MSIFLTSGDLCNLLPAWLTDNNYLSKNLIFAQKPGSNQQLNSTGQVMPFPPGIHPPECEKGWFQPKKIKKG